MYHFCDTNSIATINKKIQTQLALIEIQLLQIQAEAKDYDTDWLGPGGKVTRNASGQFAKRGGDSSGSPERSNEIAQKLQNIQNFVSQSTQGIQNAISKLDKQSKEIVNKNLQGLGEELEKVGKGFEKVSQDFSKEFNHHVKEIAKKVDPNQSLEKNFEKIAVVSNAFLSRAVKDITGNPDLTKENLASAAGYLLGIFAGVAVVTTIIGSISMGLVEAISLGAIAGLGITEVALGGALVLGEHSDTLKRFVDIALRPVVFGRLFRSGIGL